MNYQYTSDIKEDVLFRAGEPTDGTSDYDDKVLEYINRVYQAIWQGGQEFAPDVNEDWLWLQTRGVLTLVPPVEADTVAVTRSSTSITFSTAPKDPEGGAISVQGWFLRVEDHPDVFQIAVHTAGQVAATLDSVYTGDSRLAAQYKCFKLEYDLATDVMRLVGPMWVRTTTQLFPYRPGEISVTSDLETLRAMWPLDRITASVPSMAALIADQKVRFNTYPLSYLRVEYDYLRLPSALVNATNEEPLIPLKDRRVLADGALGFVFMDKNDNRADAEFIRVTNQLRAMANENRARRLAMDNTFGRFYPRMDKLSTLLPTRTSSGLIVG